MLRRIHADQSEYEEKGTEQLGNPQRKIMKKKKKMESEVSKEKGDSTGYTEQEYLNEKLRTDDRRQTMKKSALREADMAERFQLARQIRA